ncbi:MAG: MFS transporter [Betaproteobacteria bacterium RBG_16_58_11]|nr:MAG: MFS transporter [Betaproteobacteria bacterium RBG_16_58_11]OFZ94551.1 MAG: MFS transporter [Betaproteobacteria bacterium RBG_19FT_COMBO_58_11]
MSDHQAGSYYLPEPSGWPIVGSAAVALLASGLVMWSNHVAPGGLLILAGLMVLFYMMFGWFGRVIAESESGKYDQQVDRSFRWGMSWFIFSEVMFFAAFFGALFYMRVLSVPWLGEGDTNAVLWEGFKAAWPSTGPSGQTIIAPMTEAGPGQLSPMSAWGVPAINTLILLSSGVTVTIAHWGLKKGNRGQLNLWLALTVALGAVFLYLQATEYHEAYTKLGLTLASGAYGATFFMLTGFHGLHVTIGTIMLTVMLVRCLKGHFTPDSHFAFEAVSWYWHFVDVVWLGLFVFVYWL